MTSMPTSASRILATCLVSAFGCMVGLGQLWGATANDWFSLAAQAGLADWRGEHPLWKVAGNVVADKTGQKLRMMPGESVLVSEGDAANLESKKDYQDVEVRLEFMIPAGSNSGVKLMGRYEIQILDTHDVKDLSGDVCGGIYPRAEDFPSYHHIDHGIAPRVNAAKAAGEWQKLEITFAAPRFDAAGRKKSNARFVRVLLNGQLIHENVEVAAPTGAAWRLVPEVPCGPLLLQGDHGPVAFRNVAIRSHR